MADRMIALNMFTYQNVCLCVGGDEYFCEVLWFEKNDDCFISCSFDVYHNQCPVTTTFLKPLTNHNSTYGDEQYTDANAHNKWLL